MFLQLGLGCLHSSTALIFFREQATVSLLIVFYRHTCWFLKKEKRWRFFADFKCLSLSIIH